MAVSQSKEDKPAAVAKSSVQTKPSGQTSLGSSRVPSLRGGGTRDQPNHFCPGG